MYSTYRCMYICALICTYTSYTAMYRILKKVHDETPPLAISTPTKICRVDFPGSGMRLRQAVNVKDQDLRTPKHPKTRRSF